MLMSASSGLNRGMDAMFERNDLVNCMYEKHLGWSRSSESFVSQPQVRGPSRKGARGLTN